MKTRNDSSVNAGSMADIAFLLLIFFLVVTTIETDQGINQKLAEDCPECPIPVKHERNILRVILGSNNDLFIEDELASIESIKKLAKNFIDNNGDKSCGYCNGKSEMESSDNPLAAVVSLQHDRQTDYKFYVTVLNELIAAYTELREEYAIKNYKKPLALLSKQEMKKVKENYPRLISEARTNQ